MRTEKLSRRRRGDGYLEYRFPFKTLHHPTKPALVYGPGTSDYYLYGKLHRINGPARVYKVIYLCVTRYKYLLQGQGLLEHENRNNLC